MDQRWHETKIQDSVVFSSNPDFPLESGLSYQHNFIHDDQAQQLLEDISKGEYVSEGFDQRRRVQRFNLQDSNVPQAITALALTLQEQTSCRQRATQAVIEEYHISKWSHAGEYASNHQVTLFETMETIIPEKHFVALIPLNKSAIMHMNKPAQRQAQCWELESSKHSTNVLMEQHSLIIRSETCLRDWRTRIAASPDSSEPVVVVKFYHLPPVVRSNQSEDDEFGYFPKDNPSRGPVPKLSDILTIIITTSPIKSHPSTELLERTMATFQRAGPEFCRCRKVIVCDGVRIQQEGVTKKHGNVKQAMRNGIVSDHQNTNYQEFKIALQQLCASATLDSPFHNTVIEELSERHGYGFALRHALRYCVETEYVCVIQHDRTFMRPTPILETINAMWNDRKIKYVGMSMRSNLMYRDIFLAKYGSNAIDTFNECTLRVPELLVDAQRYGPNSASTRCMLETNDKLRENLQSLSETYRGSSQYAEYAEWCKDHPVPEGQHQMTLTPTLFWYDNTHICETAHYRDFIFHPKYKMVARGGFVEDKLSPVLKRTVERLGLKDGHSRFGCFLLDDHSGLFFTGHLDGGAYMTEKERMQFGTNNI